MNRDQLTFGDCAELLRMNGFAPAPLSPDTGRPLGPFAVMQIPYARHESNNPLPAGVLTQVPLPRSPDEPVQNARATWLATVTVRVRPDLAADAEAIVKRYAGDNCPVRVDHDGGRCYVLRLAGEGFSAVSTDYNEHGDHVSVSGGPDFVPIAGEWAPAGGLLIVQCDQLPEINRADAVALVEAINALLVQHAPPTAPVRRYVPKPLPNLAAGERLEFGHALAAHTMKEHGYEICPVPWGQSRPSDSWYMSASFGVQWNPDTATMGVGAFCALNPAASATWLSFVEISGDPEQVARTDAVIIARLGAGLLRVAADGTRLRLYLQPAWDRLTSERQHTVSPEPYVAGKSVRLRFGSAGAVVVSGTDANGNAYLWPDGSPLTVKRAALPELSGSTVDHRLLDQVRDALGEPASDTAAPGTRRRSRA